MPTPYLSRLNIPMKNAGYTPSQGTAVGSTGFIPQTGGGSPYEPAGAYQHRGGNIGLGYTGGHGGAVGIPAQTQYSGMTPQYYANLQAQQKNNAAAYGYDAQGNWSLLNGQQDYVDANGSKTAYQPLFEQYSGMRPTGYSGSVPGRTNGVAPTGSSVTTSPVTSAVGIGNSAPLAGSPVSTLARPSGKRSDSQAYGGAAQYNQFQNYNNPLGTGLGEMYQGGTPYSGVNTGVNMDFSKALWR
jgi:hypothetical protein